MKTHIEEAALELAYSYDGTLEGLFSAIFAAYANHENPLDIAPRDRLQLRLGQEERQIETNVAHAQRVARSIASAGGKATFEAVKKASVSSDPHVGTTVFHFVQKLMKERGYLLNQLADPVVGELMRLVKAVDVECERMRQFVRFSHLESGGWFAVCNPRDNVIPLVMNWFAARFNDQSFAIYDEVHHIAGVYEKNSWYLVSTSCFNAPIYSSEECLMQDAWRLFYRTLSIDARYNPELRRQHMPVRYWCNLTEMQQPESALGAQGSHYAAVFEPRLNAPAGNTQPTSKATPSALPNKDMPQQQE